MFQYCEMGIFTENSQRWKIFGPFFFFNSFLRQRPVTDRFYQCFQSFRITTLRCWWYFLGYQSGGLAVIVHSSLVVKVDEISTSKGYKVFPNPANHTVRIACNEGRNHPWCPTVWCQGQWNKGVFNQGLLDLSKEQKRCLYFADRWK